VNERFIGAWRLHSYETLGADGQVVEPLGACPRGMFCFAASGHFAVQLGPEVHEEGRYTAFYGTFDVTDGETGVLTLHLETGSNPERISGDQVRRFRFTGPGEVKLQPPAAADGSQSTITWRRAVATQD
jgi:hypothetical protein